MMCCSIEAVWKINKKKLYRVSFWLLHVAFLPIWSELKHITVLIFRNGLCWYWNINQRTSYIFETLQMRYFLKETDGYKIQTLQISCCIQQTNINFPNYIKWKKAWFPRYQDVIISNAIAMLEFKQINKIKNVNSMLRDHENIQVWIANDQLITIHCVSMFQNVSVIILYRNVLWRS